MFQIVNISLGSLKMVSDMEMEYSGCQIAAFLLVTGSMDPWMRENSTNLQKTIIIIQYSMWDMTMIQIAAPTQTIKGHHKRIL